MLDGEDSLQHSQVQPILLLPLWKKWAGLILWLPKMWIGKSFPFLSFQILENDFTSLNLMHIVQSCIRLHHRAGSDPLELHGTVYTVVCLQCGSSVSRNSFQEQVKALNPKVWTFTCIIWFVLFFIFWINFTLCVKINTHNYWGLLPYKQNITS